MGPGPRATGIQEQHGTPYPRCQGLEKRSLSEATPSPTREPELRTRGTAEPAVGAFLLKTDPTRLLPLAQRLTGLDAQSTDVLSPADSARRTSSNRTRPR